MCLACFATYLIRDKIFSALFFRFLNSQYTKIFSRKLGQPWKFLYFLATLVLVSNKIISYKKSVNFLKIKFVTA